MLHSLLLGSYYGYDNSAQVTKFLREIDYKLREN